MAGAVSAERHADRLNATDENNVAEQGVMEGGTLPTEHEEEITWRSLPHRRQLIILTLSRLSEPLVQTSLQAYMYYQLKSFNESLPDSTIAKQVGLLSGSFPAAQSLTAMLWGRVSDSEWGGRKTVLLIGLFGTGLSCLGFGFAQTFYQALFFRALGGMLNGNVGVLRTMVSEIVQEKKYQARAFLLLPMTFNIGVIIGPILGGLLADLAGTYPGLFGHIKFLKMYPYASPNILNAIFLFAAGCGVLFGLEETLESIRHKEDIGAKITRTLSGLFGRKRGKYQYSPLPSEDPEGEEESTATPKRLKAIPRWKQKLPFNRMFTHNVVYTLLAHTLMATQTSTYNSLWLLFLSTPVATNRAYRRLPFIFTGGLGMSASHVGFAMAILGFIGISLQLSVYPIVTAKLGTVKSWRIFLTFFPVVYMIVPYLSLVPSKTPPPAEKDGPLIWFLICSILMIQVSGRTFALPATTILVNNASPHPSVLGTMHGIAQSLNSAGRSIGPVIGGSIYALGLRIGVVGAAWWVLSVVALCNCVAARWVTEGSGHEIILDGDQEAQEEWEARRRSTR